MAQYDNWIDKIVYDKNNTDIGTVEGLYVDEVDGSAKWITIKSGLFGGKIRFVPADMVEEIEDGIAVPFEKDVVSESPDVTNSEVITLEEEKALSAYYSQENMPIESNEDEVDDVEREDELDSQPRNVEDDELKNDTDNSEHTFQDQEFNASHRTKLRRYVIVRGEAVELDNDDAEIIAPTNQSNKE